MDLSQQKEQFSNTYVRAVASAAGYSVYKPSVDDESVDLGIAAKGRTGIVRSPRLELQLKCTSVAALDDCFVRYPLKLKNYNDLRMEDFAIPRILIVVLVPNLLADWLQQSETELCMKHCGYWLSLRGMPDTRNTNNVTVRLPRNHLFTVSALQSIMQLISEGGTP